LKIGGSVTAEGLVEVNGHIEGDLHCTSLVVSPKAWRRCRGRSCRGRRPGRGPDPRRRGRAQVARACRRRHPAQFAGDRVGAYFDGRSVRSPESNVRKAQWRSRRSSPRGLGASPRRTGASPPRTPRLSTPDSSWPGLSRPSNRELHPADAPNWAPGTSPGVTAEL
jgi:hypothetical protein